MGHDILGNVIEGSFILWMILVDILFTFLLIVIIRAIKRSAWH